MGVSGRGRPGSRARRKHGPRSGLIDRGAATRPAAPCRNQGYPQIPRLSRGHSLNGCCRTGGSWHSEAHAQTRQAGPAARRGQSNAIPRHPQGSRDCPRILWAMRGPDRPPTSDLSPGLAGTADHRNPGASGSVNRFFRLLVQSDPTTRTGFMIADAVRYMSVHSWTQWDSHGLSGTSSG